MFKKIREIREALWQNDALRRRVNNLEEDAALSEALYQGMNEDLKQSYEVQDQLQEKISQRDDMLRICRDGRLQAEKDARAFKEALKASNFKLNSATDAIKIFAERYKISPDELRQLQVAALIAPDADRQGFEKPTSDFSPFDNTDPLVMLNAGNDFKQTAGKFRQLRQSFVTLQLAITGLFDGLEMQAKKAAVTRDQIRSARDAVSGKIGRKI